MGDVKMVTYHDPNSGDIKPAFILKENKPAKKSGKPSYFIMVVDTGGNYTVNKVSEGKKAGQIET